MNHYWSQSYNSISSLLSGAVVAGESGNAAIYYNPANIVEIENGSNISLAASFLTLNHYSMTDAMGDNQNLSTTNFYVQPQFFSIGVNSPFNKWSFEIATFNRVKDQLVLDYARSQELSDDVNESANSRLISQFHYKNYYSDDWIGIGGAYTVNENLHIGMSLNFSFSSLDYDYQISAQIHTLSNDSTIVNDQPLIVLAENSYKTRISFTNARLITKIGVAYKNGNWRLGLNISLPPLNIMTVGKRALRSEKEVYSMETTEGNIVVDYFIFDAQEENIKKANYKLPFSLAIGVVYEMNNNKKLYSSMEYFAGLRPYKLIDAPLNKNITTDVIYESLDNKDWLSVAYGAVPVVNIAVGYSWQIRPKVLFMMGLRTDFNNIKDMDYGKMDDFAKLNTSNLNIYHVTGGVLFHYKKHQLLAGTQISIGRKKNAMQIANFNPNYKPNYGNDMPLLGKRESKSNLNNFSISLFLGATLNFESKKQEQQ
jgi:hypothetical protein